MSTMVVIVVIRVAVGLPRKAANQDGSATQVLSEHATHQVLIVQHRALLELVDKV